MSVISQQSAEHYIWGNNCDGWHLVKSKQLSVIQERVPPGSFESRHFHQKSEQFFFVLSGIATIEVEGEVLTVNPLQGVHVGAGKAHQLSNQHNRELVFTVTSTPPSHGDKIEQG
ncbi:cupin domain-containing protein [Shewanella japonica]|uniref:Cupin n=1 Tax=Shewanella japonica TaxID=93973 RepID=A0ABM6JJS7_9GAMM|nr:cupin domain-containing protein [Shewanella japonica]ARD21848.1 cupin [Shewanella japonica]